MYDGGFEAALETLRPILSETPGHIDALYMAAACHRYLDNTDEAFALVRKLKAEAPEFGRAYQEEGHLYSKLGRAGRALSAYRKACLANPGLEASWRGQADLLRKAGRRAEAAQAASQAERLAALPGDLLAVTNMIHEGRLLKAERLCKHFLKSQPRHIEAMRLLADIASRLGALQEADFLLESALEFEPENTQVRLDYIQILRKEQKFEAALAQAELLFETEPDNPVFQSQYAVQSMYAGDFETAISMFGKVLETMPADPATLTSRGHALKTIGEHEKAIASYREAYRSDPGHGEAYHALANLKTYRFTDDELSLMRKQQEGDAITHVNRIQLCFALGKAYEERADYARSFAFYERGNDLKRHQSRYDPDQMDEEFQTQIEVCTPELFERQAGNGCPAPDPIFIVGLPRAGSTLLEQILSSHSKVDGTLELPNILALVHRLRDRKKVDAETGYPKILRSLTASQLREFGETYIEETRLHRAGAPYFTDKMPNNFRHIGLIHLILPNAKIIDARREPMSCCFSGFKQLFAEGQEFTYGLEQIGRYYRGYVELMDHWDKVLPGRILRVHYEDVVADLESEVHRILEFCDLEFEDSCLEYHRTERAVRTASSEQVRQPIYKSGLEQWRHFEPFLEPLKKALGPALESYRKA